MPRPYEEGDGTEGCAGGGGEQLLVVRDVRWLCSPLTATSRCWQVHLLSAVLGIFGDLCEMSVPVTDLC